MRKFFFLLLLLTVFLPSYSIDTHWDLEPQIIKNGVGNNTIYHVCYGSEGFMWFSTDKGISRYDGFRFRDYPLIMSVDLSLIQIFYVPVPGFYGTSRDQPTLR